MTTKLDFAHKAVSCAMRAKAGVLTSHDVMHLDTRLREMSADFPSYAAAIRPFVADLDVLQTSGKLSIAGEALHAAVLEMFPAPPDSPHPGDWRDRVDING